MIIDGKQIQQKYTQSLIQKVEALEHKPVLVIIQIGENQESSVYINQKIKFGKKIGVPVEFYQLEEKVEFDFIKKLISDFNHDDDIAGIIIQLPLPKHLQELETDITDCIDPHKDVDGLASYNLKKLMQNEKGIVPATARGVLTLLEETGTDLAGKNIVIIGRSVLVGRSLGQLLLNKDATVTICHSKTKNLSHITSQADIIIVAVGKPGLISDEYVKEGQILIDIGTTLHNGVLVGDVEFDSVSKIVEHITPVPGGVGPMTVLSLFQNLID